jgi:hypothetical protein
MTIGTSPDVDQVVASIDEFSEEALRNAIEEARNPEKAAQLIERLRLESEGNRERFTGVALCVVLGEAKAEQAIPLLLETATRECDGLLREAALYALQRMGPPAIEAAMSLIPNAANPWERALAYEILSAAANEDYAFRSRVADFCLSRAQSQEPVDFKKDDWNPYIAVCSTLVDLGDARVLPLVDEGLARATDYDEIMDWAYMRRRFLRRERDVSEEFDPPVDWPEQCRKWAETFAGMEEWNRVARIEALKREQERLQLDSSWDSDELAESDPWSREPKIGRNQPCPCGSGHKYKKCCGRDI